MTDITKIKAYRAELGYGFFRYISNKLELLCSNQATEMDHDYLLYAFVIIRPKLSYDAFHFYKHIYNNVCQCSELFLKKRDNGRRN